MFEYNYNPRTHELFVTLPQNMKFDYSFHCDVAGLLYHALGNDENNEKIESVILSCKQDVDYDKMSKAYLCNVLGYLLSYRRVKWNMELKRQITSTVSIRDGAKFQEISMGDELQKSDQSYYVFHGDKNVQKPVDEITKLLVEKNITLDEEEIKEFLSTTIGEIFSNSINHSNQDEIFFMFDIHYEKDDFYLCVNVIDYGTTIITNVKEFLKTEKNNAFCMNWAIQSGNTTRAGSGGYGLPTLISYIQETKGTLYIISGDIIYQFENSNAAVQTVKGFFYGTSITFMVKLYNDEIMRFDKEHQKIKSISLDDI